MKISRRGFFGLGAGAAAVPFVKPVEAKAVRRLIVADDPNLYFEPVVQGMTTGGPKLLWPGLNVLSGVTYKER